MMRLQLSLKAVLVTAVMVGWFSTAPLSAAVVTTYTYDVATEIGAAGIAISTDGWAAVPGQSGLSNWVTATQNGVRYIRNNNDADRTVYRPNDAGWSYSIPAVGTTQVDIRVIARTSGSDNRFIEIGLAKNTAGSLGNLFAVGDRYSNGNAFIMDGGTRHVGTSHFPASNPVIEILLTITENGNGQLVGTLSSRNTPGSGTYTTRVSNQVLSTTWADLADTNALYVRTNTMFVGPSVIEIAVVPEPASLAGLGVGGLLLLRRRRGLV